MKKLKKPYKDNKSNVAEYTLHKVSHHNGDLTAECRKKDTHTDTECQQDSVNIPVDSQPFRMIRDLAESHQEFNRNHREDTVVDHTA